MIFIIEFYWKMCIMIKYTVNVMHLLSRIDPLQPKNEITVITIPTKM